jgi:hypothetical protein
MEMRKLDPVRTFHFLSIPFTSALGPHRDRTAPGKVEMDPAQDLSKPIKAFHERARTPLDRVAPGKLKWIRPRTFQNPSKPFTSALGRPSRAQPLQS